MEELNNLKELNEGLTFVEVYSTFCNSCKKQVKIIESLISKFPSIKFTKVNNETEVGAKICKDYQLSQAPSMLIFKDGTLLKQFGGLTIPNKLNEILNEVSK